MPEIVERAAQHYVAVVGDVTMDRIPEIADRLPEVFGWLAGKGVTPVGPPFLKYDVIDMARRLLIEAGVPVAGALDGDGDVVAGVLPAGRYVTTTHVGHPRELERVTGELLAWAQREGLTFDMEPLADGEHWGARLEEYLTDPREEPDLAKWETVLAFRLRSDPTAG